MTIKKTKNIDVILGVFIFIALIALVLLIFLIGKERRLFDVRYRLEAHFPNVQGLLVGADVLLSGVVVGHVAEVNFPVLRSDLQDSPKDITVVLKISKIAMEWIRTDSEAEIVSKGLLGDKLINISIGSQEKPYIPKGGMIKSKPPFDLNRSFEKAQKIIEDVSETVAGAKDMFKSFTKEGGDIALASSAKSLQRVLKEVEEGKGIINELVFNKDASLELTDSIKNLALLIKQAKEGPGLVNALLYDKSGKEALLSLSNILKQLENKANDTNFIKSLGEAAFHIESIAKDVNEGRGSLGLLIKDQSLYNELYGLIGNINRSKILKAVVRYNLSKKGQKSSE